MPHAVDATISLAFRTNRFLGTSQKATELIGVFQSYNDIFSPEEFDVERERSRPNWVSFDDNLELAVRMLTQHDPASLVARRRRRAKVDLNIVPSRSDFFDLVSLVAEERWFRDAGHLEKLIAFAKDLHCTIEGSSGYIKNDQVEARFDRIEGYRGNTFYSEPRFPGVHNRLPGLFWANFFGPEYVEMWSRDFLLRSPCHKHDELQDGSIVLYLSDSPLAAGTEEYANQKQRLYTYLGTEVFEGKRLPVFRTTGQWRKKRRARPLVQTGGLLDDVFAEDAPRG